MIVASKKTLFWRPPLSVKMMGHNRGEPPQNHNYHRTAKEKTPESCVDSPLYADSKSLGLYQKSYPKDYIPFGRTCELCRFYKRYGRYGDTLFYLNLPAAIC